MTPIGGWSRSTLLHGLAEELATARFPARRGRIVRVTGTLLEAMFPGASLGEECEVDGVGLAETVGFREGEYLKAGFWKVGAGKAPDAQASRR